MIKLERNFTPLFFSPQNVSRLTEKFKSSGTHVWHHDDVKNSLMELSDKKCAYCEVKLGEKAHIMRWSILKIRMITLMM